MSSARGQGQPAAGSPGAGGRPGRRERLGQVTLALMFAVIALVLVSSLARDGEWALVAFVVGANVVFYGGRALFRRSPYADPGHPMWPSKDPGDYR